MKTPYLDFLLGLWYTDYKESEVMRMSMSNEKAWDYAIGIVQVDGIKPSDDFLDLVEKEKRGEMTGDDIRRVLDKKYIVKED
jgi:hypothetical protein